MFLGGIPGLSSILERPGQVSSVDFVGCIKGVSLNGFEKNLFREAKNVSGITDTCNQVEGGACNKGSECGRSGMIRHFVFDTVRLKPDYF